MVTPSSNKQTRLIIILIVFVGLVSGYVYYSNFSTVDDQGIPAIKEDSKDNLKEFSNVTFNFKVFSSTIINYFSVFGDSPVHPDSTGRTNPFISF